MIDDRIGNMVVFDVLRILQVQFMRKINIKNIQQILYKSFYNIDQQSLLKLHRPFQYLKSTI